MDPVIASYAAEFRRSLRGPLLARLSITREVQDGLVDAAEAYQRAGVADPSRRAVTEFGSAHEVAARFGDDMAAAAGRQTAGLMLLGGFLSFVLSTLAWRSSVADSRAAGAAEFVVPDFYRVTAISVDYVAGAALLASVVALWLLFGGVPRTYAIRRLTWLVGWATLIVLVIRTAGGVVLTAYAPVPVPLASATTSITVAATTAVAWSAWRCVRLSSPAPAPAEGSVR